MKNTFEICYEHPFYWGHYNIRITTNEIEQNVSNKLAYIFATFESLTSNYSYILKEDIVPFLKHFIKDIEFVNHMLIPFKERYGNVEFIQIESSEYIIEESFSSEELREYDNIINKDKLHNIIHNSISYKYHKEINGDFSFYNVFFSKIKIDDVYVIRFHLDEETDYTFGNNKKVEKIIENCKYDYLVFKDKYFEIIQNYSNKEFLKLMKQDYNSLVEVDLSMKKMKTLILEKNEIILNKRFDYYPFTYNTPNICVRFDYSSYMSLNQLEPSSYKIEVESRNKLRNEKGAIEVKFSRDNFPYMSLFDFEKIKELVDKEYYLKFQARIAMSEIKNILNENTNVHHVDYKKNTRLKNKNI